MKLVLWGRDSKDRKGSAYRSSCVVLLCLGVLACLPAAAQSAVKRHVFNATLSLTGGCATDEWDGIVDPWCPGPPKPSAPFENPNITVDSFGDMYVSSHQDEGAGGRVDVFGPQGNFITELAVDGSRSIAVDPKGHLYVAQFVVGGVKRVTVFTPTVYDPGAAEIAYEEPGDVIIDNQLPPPASCTEHWAPGVIGVAVDPVTENLFVSPGGGCVAEWSSAETPGGNTLLDATIGVGNLNATNSYIAVDAANSRLYVADTTADKQDGVIQVFDLQPPHAHLGTLSGAATPAGKFNAPAATNTLDVDEATGNVFVSDLNGGAGVYEMGPGLDSAEEYLSNYKFGGFLPVTPGEIAVDNSAVSPNQGTFYVPADGHTFAFAFSEEVAPEIESLSVSGVGERDAVLRAIVNPGGGETEYRLEIEGPGIIGAAMVGQGVLPPTGEGVEISAPASGLVPGARYQIRISVENVAGADQASGSFRTYPASIAGGSCPNDAMRHGFSANLPDCRAYELVTPPDTNGRSPVGAPESAFYFPTLQASPDGSKATFRIEGGTLPGSEGSGSFSGDNYLSRRGPAGWTTEIAGPSGTDALAPQPGAFSADQEHSFWQGEDPESDVPVVNPYVRYPNGTSEPVGRGSLGVTSSVDAELISNDGSHIIFATKALKDPPPLQLEPDAPPTGTAAVYDRTADEVTHVVSLLPGNVTPAPDQNAAYVGASYDGRGVAFEIKGTLYLRQDNQTTYEVGKGVTYAGVAEGGGRIFYLSGGNLLALDTASGLRISFSKGGDTTPVNVSPDGTGAYFLSPDRLTGEKTSPNGTKAQPGQNNLYFSREGELSFVGIVEPSDVEEFPAGLGMWVSSLNVDGRKPGSETSRTTPHGDVLLFESRAPLAGYDPDGHTEIYRYDAKAPSLTCLSCNPTEAPANSDASLQTISRQAGAAPVLGLPVRVLNIRPGGDRAFFQSFEPLVPYDTDGRQDVYEWEAQGVGSCTQSGGCVYLISSGQSERDEHLFAVSESGDDVFFLSGNLLLGSDRDSTPSIYDARVDGGFPETTESSPCQGEGCRSDLSQPPTLPVPATPANGTNGNVSAGRCPKGKRKVVRKGKAHCVKKKQHRHQQRRHRTHSKGGAGR